MKVKQDFTFSEKIVIQLASPSTWIIILIITLAMSVGIIFCSDELVLGNIDLSSTGWTNFWNLFKAPISVLLGGTTIFGILLAIRRTIILEEQMRLSLEQHKINSHNIFMNNYYRHQDEFIKMLRDFRASIRLYGSQGPDHDLDFYRKLYIVIYGKKYESTNTIPNEKIELSQRIIDEFLKLFPNQERQRSDFIAKSFQDLGFIDKIPADHVHIGNNTMDANLQDSLKILVKIVEFSDQDNILNNLNELKNIIYR